MEPFPLRLLPGQDLRGALEALLRDKGCSAAFVLSGIGSLAAAQLRLAGAREPRAWTGEAEMLTLAGTIAPNGAHLHMSLAMADGSVLGGHVAPGCIVRTTAEILLLFLPGWTFTRDFDPSSGFDELLVRREGSAK
jgi:predicted DNA-binding protein with PD1-like motif